jgi:hypothetical protein
MRRGTWLIDPKTGAKIPAVLRTDERGRAVTKVTGSGDKARLVGEYEQTTPAPAAKPAKPKEE